ncbi:MAG TPA: VOC family protein [Sphingobium sp.]|nr:VOC family protein [Sphingobium sp.]
MKLAKLGEVMQIAFVPEDFEGMLRYWTQMMGVGPFYVQPRLSIPTLRYRGEPTDAIFTVAIAYWGDIQIELIEQHNDAPSIYKQWRDGGHEGVNHSCIVVEDIEEARRTAVEAGMAIAQEIPGDGWGVLYVDTGGGPGTMLEIIQPNEGMLGRFARIKADSLDWDGSDPVRYFS